MVGQHVRAGFYQAGSPLACLSKLDHTLFTHLIYLSSLPDRYPRDDDLRHASTFAHAIPPSTKALLALPFSLHAPHGPDLLGNSIEMAREHHFEGVHFILDAIDVDFLQFCVRWREAAAQESRLTGRRPLLLTASFYRWCPSLTVPSGEPFPLHWLCLRGYHQGLSRAYSSQNRLFSFVGSSFTFSHTALYNCQPRWSIHLDIRTCLDAGLDPSFLVLGLAMHGFSFQLKDPSVHGMHAPCLVPKLTAHGIQAITKRRDLDRPIVRPKLPHQSEFGSVAYRDVVEFIEEHKAKYCHNSTTQSAYCYVGTTWIGYDDTFTVSQKVDYIRSMGLKGYALDSLHEDTPNLHLSHAARSSFLAKVKSKQITIIDKGKQLKGKQKRHLCTQKEISDFGVHLSSR